MSASDFQCIVFFGLLFRFPSGFQVSACLVMQFDDFPNVCPIHLQRLFLIFSSVGMWLVHSHNRLLLIVSVQQTSSILSRQSFINTCTFSITIVVVVLQVSASYSQSTNRFRYPSSRKCKKLRFSDSLFPITLMN